MTSDRETFEAIETGLDLFSLTVDDVPTWERVRFNAFREISRQRGRGQAHTRIDSDLSDHLCGIGLWLRNAIYRNPYVAGKHEVLFFGHNRRKLESDGYWWDIYCDPIHEQGDLDYVHFESPRLLTHKTPAKTENLRYLELLDFTGTLQRKLGLRKPDIPEDVVDRLKEAEATIKKELGADVDLVSKVREKLHVRKTTLPLYERLLERTDPELVVVVVAYGRETLIEACKRKGIPVVELQHGVIYDYHYGYSYPEGETKYAFPDYLLTFGEFWNENVRFPLPDERVIPVGYPYLEERLNTYADVKRSEQLLFISQGTIGAELSRFALAVHDDDRVDHEVVYKLHPGEYDRWEGEYPWLAKSDVRVIDEPEPPLYRLFAESTAQVGVGSTAVYEGLCFGLETFVFDTDGADVLQPLVEDEVASAINDADDLTAAFESNDRGSFDRERFFKSDSVANIIRALQSIQQESV